MKLIHLEVKSCEHCLYTDQDEEGVYCYGVSPAETLLTRDEAYLKGMSVKKKYDQPFPPFCPLPDVQPKEEN